MQEYDAVVIGAGVSGMVSDATLARSTNGPVLLIDELHALGGKHIAVAIGPYTFDIGSFFFQDVSLILENFSSMLETYQNIGGYSISKLTPRGSISKYPVDIRSDILALGPIDVVWTLLSVLWSRVRVDPNRNAGAYADDWIGRRFAVRSGLQNYLRRFYGVSPERIEAVCARKRMGWIASHGSLKGALKLLRPKATSQATNNELVRPREGFGVLYAPASKVLTESGVHIALGGASFS